MATYTDTLGYNKGSAGFHAKALNKVFVSEIIMDFAAITAARLAASATALGAGDILQALHVPAKTVVLKAGIEVVTAEGGTMTLDLGDGADPDGYLDGVDGNATAGTGYASALAVAEGTPNTIVGYSNGKYYDAADTIDIVQVNAADTMELRIWALMVDVSGIGGQ